MKFTINSKKLYTSLQLLSKGVSTNTIVPATSCFRFEGGDKLNLSSCNFEVSMQTSIDTTVPAGLDILLPADKLIKLLSGLAEQSISFTAKEGQVSIKTLSGTYEMPCESGVEFPVIKVNTDSEAIIQSADLSEAIYRTSYARATDAAQALFLPLSMELSADKATFVACNLHILSAHNIDGEFTPSNLLLPTSIVNILSGINLPGEVVIKYSKNSICFEYAGLKVKSLLTDGTYPDWKAVTPVNDIELTIDRVQMLSAVKRILEFSNKASKLVKLVADGKTLTLSGEDVDYKQRATEVIACISPEILFGLNGGYLVDVLSHMVSETVTLYYQSKTVAIIIKEAAEDENFVLIMPNVTV